MFLTGLLSHAERKMKERECLVCFCRVTNMIGHRDVSLLSVNTDKQNGVGLGMDSIHLFWRLGEENLSLHCSVIGCLIPFVS